ncbi:hypothetical protein I3843_04G107500 [Carya illinoinensis]|uniref:Ubiquitin-like domain-containing protein n=1 Tax=Carya illinoinensis TaxID=32201 RepID=A0A8T1QTG2_CARIL|nr:uncharacterized protein LOC122306286 [Carya illinoinensis]KAG2712250.1 hypothetical protein I3760_04G115400 [Carya illinoinensis]KAG6657817.1 hypothetical protein CIPAW_04G117200 [Carya illinoinensis]KAG6717734.1 hypothetical protein I3842_04G115100 [Carya illinoinensis]KAG7983470.1 hypothetical protein I3843_04G107500 [Carya illinoinensis]
MRLVVENLTGTLFYIQVGNDATLADLKREIEAQQELPFHRLILMLDTNHTPLMTSTDEDGVLLMDCGVKDGSHIYLFFNPLDDASTQDQFVFSWPDSLLG